MSVARLAAPPRDGSSTFPRPLSLYANGSMWPWRSLSWRIVSVRGSGVASVDGTDAKANAAARVRVKSERRASIKCSPDVSDPVYTIHGALLMNMSKMAVLSTAALASMSTGANAAQRIAVPSNIYPGPAWSAIEQGAPSVGMVIVYPISGRGDARVPNYQIQVHEALAHGIKVLGYVATSNGKKAAPDVEREIDTYERWYGVDGFLLDEAANTLDKLPNKTTQKTYIVMLNPHAVTVIIPGTQTI